MFAGIFRISMLVVTGKFLKHRYKGLLLLFASWVLLWFLQSEYLSYVDYSGDTSYVLHVAVGKVCLILLSLFFYALLVERRIVINSSSVNSKKAQSNPIFNTAKSSAKPKEDGPNQSLVKVNPGDDGFDFLRYK